MKLLTVLFATALSLCGLLSAQNSAERILIPGTLILEEKEFEDVFLLGATNVNVYYVPVPNSVKVEAKRRSEVLGVYIKEPKDYSEALALFENRKYNEALAKFREVKKRYSKFLPLPGNHATLAGFYEMECLRNLEDLEGLAAAVADFQSENLQREDQLQQVEIYIFWDAVRQKQWERLDLLSKEWTKRRVPISHRAQIAYCHALSLEALKRPMEALNTYAVAMTADFTKSEVIVRNSVLNSLRVYASLPEVQTAMKLWGSSDEEPNSTGYALLTEANALARLYNAAGFGAGVELPTLQKAFLKYTPKELPKAKEKKDAAAKPAEEKKEDK